jgi:hypothetical protein
MTILLGIILFFIGGGLVYQGMGFFFRVARVLSKVVVFLVALLGLGLDFVVYLSVASEAGSFIGFIIALVAAFVIGILGGVICMPLYPFVSSMFAPDSEDDAPSDAGVNSESKTVTDAPAETSPTKLN